MFELLSCCHVMAVSTGQSYGLAAAGQTSEIEEQVMFSMQLLHDSKIPAWLGLGKNCCLPVSCHVLVKTYAIVLSVEQQHKSRGLQLVVEFMK
jgi:hypothetical protein